MSISPSLCNKKTNINFFSCKKDFSLNSFNISRIKNVTDLSLIGVAE